MLLCMSARTAIKYRFVSCFILIVFACAFLSVSTASGSQLSLHSVGPYRHVKHTKRKNNSLSEKKANALFLKTSRLTRRKLPLPNSSARVIVSAIPPDQVKWADDAADVPQKSLGQNWPEGTLTATASIVPTSINVNPKSPRIFAGMKNIQIVVHLMNRSSVAQRILFSQLRLMTNDQDNTPWFFILPLSALPDVIPPNGQAQQMFRVDTFDDTPFAQYHLLPQVTYVPATADLLQNGGFEQMGKINKQPQHSTAGADLPAGWDIPADAPANSEVAAIKSSSSYSALSTRIADWKDFTKLVVDNTTRIPAQGTGLLEAAHGSAGVVAEQVLKTIVPGRRYIAGVDAWGSGNIHIELLDQTGKSVGGQDRHLLPGSWRGRTITFQASKATASGKLSLFAESQKSWWDNAFCVPLDQVRRAAAEPVSLVISSPAAITKAVAYMGEDRQTEGDWIGKYGQYAFILCGMSAPEDMVGGQVRPLKCDWADMQKVYADETIRVSGKGNLRYAAWTGNPNDVQPRHYIDMPLRQGWDQVRALDNPQWGYRTSASWDDHGEVYEWGPDLYIRLRMPPGVWRVSYHFLDWNYSNSYNPRNYRLAFLDPKGAEICTARVLPPQHGTGIYKVFRVQGGRDIVLRVRKDFSLNAIIAGIFVDPLVPARGPVPQISGVTGVAASQLADATKKWRNAASSVAGFPGEANALQEYRNVLVASVGREAAARTLTKLGDQWFSDGEFWRSALAYQAVPLAAGLTPQQREKINEDRALQFRIVFPRYAVRKINEAILTLNSLPNTEKLTATRALATRLFDVAIKDHTDSNGLQRLPMLLAKAGDDALETDLGYNGLTATECAKKLAIAERMTWYTSGWEDVANEGKRFWPTLAEKQKAGLGAGFFADHIVHPLGVLAQSDHAYLDQSVVLVNDFVRANPGTDAAGFAQYELATIYYQQGQNDQVSGICNAVISQHPDSRPAALCRQLLKSGH